MTNRADCLSGPRGAGLLLLLAGTLPACQTVDEDRTMILGLENLRDAEIAGARKPTEKDRLHRMLEQKVTGFGRYATLQFQNGARLRVKNYLYFEHGKKRYVETDRPRSKADRPDGRAQILQTWTEGEVEGVTPGFPEEVEEEIREEPQGPES